MKIITIILLILIIAILIIVTFIFIGQPDDLINSGDIEIEWNHFKQKYNKTYDHVLENERRKKLYLKSKKLIIAHNKRYAKGLESYTLGINRFADLTDSEYIGAFHKDDSQSGHGTGGDEGDDYETLDRLANLTAEQHLVLTQNIFEYNITDIQDLPEYINWIERGFNNSILDQGDCGSCYIFSSLAAIEAHYYIKYKSLLQLSHQEVLDCATFMGSTGCSGGYMEDVYSYAMLYGIGLADKNPYMGEQSKECRREKPRIFVKKQFYSRNSTELSLKEVIARFGPVTSPINAGLPTFKFYRNGLYYDPNCANGNLEHGVTTVGYGKNENKKDYWLIRNSFGKDWGENGYMYLARNRDNHCGLASEYVFPQF